MIFFRLPFSEEIMTVAGESQFAPVAFMPFDGNNSITFQGEIGEAEWSLPEILANSLPCEMPCHDGETQEEYLKKIAELIGFIKENRLPKLVYSRRKYVDFENKPVNLTGTFLKLCHAYPNAFAYFFIKENQCWMGAFSELLGHFNKKTGVFRTMSLAGTLPLADAWSEKEIAEQAAVTAHIQTVLAKYALKKIEISPLQDHISGGIKHLRTDFQAEIPQHQLEPLIADLHPTPAVCGIPKEFCLDAIRHFESEPRALYAGYSRIETEQKIACYVNLRCAKFYKDGAEIFVGGGITAQSHPQKEWDETELKARAILDNLVIS